MSRKRELECEAFRKAQKEKGHPEEWPLVFANGWRN